ncbi:hypothetical protein ACIPLC_32170 [Kitasatospora sp. NPDC086801]|uniref:hypothetical protein n=1 Tax=Kitasatospora sp. NPDC086801 TaxID=3364066 RepID=UPI00381B0B17
MIGTDVLGPDDPGPDGGEGEEELRVLLHQAVPDLATPEDRMERVRARAIGTRRRRRAAGLGAGLTAGLVAAVLAAAPAIAPTPEQGAAAGQGMAAGPAETLPGGAPTGPAAGGGTPTATPTTGSGTPTTTPTPGAQVRFPAYPNVTVDLPSGWYSQSAFTNDPQNGFGYLATGPITHAASCRTAGIACPSDVLLPVGGALLTLRLVDQPDLAGKFTASSATISDIAPDKDCLVLGGTRELLGYRAVARTGALVLIQLTACLREPSHPTLQQVQEVLDSIRTVEGISPSPPTVR